jgi:hypothetical protein
MSFFRKRKKRPKPARQTETTAAVKRPKKQKVTPVEVKLLAIDALKAGIPPSEVCELIGLGKWRKLYQEGGEGALVRQATNPGTRKICSDLEKRIEQMRRDNPEAGVRRIRDELRHGPGIGVSAETVRRVLNDAGLGNPPVEKNRRPPQTRRFEKEIPNSLWQIDIFTFNLKRMYPVYLVGMIDDHSRYIVGHGLFRQQTSQAVLEVVKGAIGQWGAPREILSDNGRQFAAWRGETRFQKVLKRQGVCSLGPSSPHDPGQNREVLENHMDRVFGGRLLCFLCRRLPETRSLDRLLQSPAAPPGHRRGLSRRPLLWSGRRCGGSP